MADIEKTGLLSSPMVRFNMAQVGILQRHVVAGKGHHLRTMLKVEIMKGSRSESRNSSSRRSRSRIVSLRSKKGRSKSS